MAYIPGRHKRGAHEDPAPRKKETRRPEDIDLLKLQKSFGELSEIHRQVKESHIEMILNLAIAAEYKDPDTGNHILRISDYSTLIGRALGLPEDELEVLRYASPMHDIGKIGIPDKILQKPGKLTPEEWEFMKQHTLIGARMFQSSKSPLLRGASQIAASHHEKYDGSGYPFGIKGEEIPLMGRIVAMVDVFDAIVSKRCYKSASSFEEGCEYLSTLSGSHLDPELIKLFLRIKPKVRQVYEANQSIQNFIDEAENQSDDLGVAPDKES